MIPVRCPDCVRANNAAEVLSVPESLRFAVVPKSAVQQGDVVHACAKCPTCGTILCAITERRQRGRDAAA
jgi:hypothetical protein